jgi:hypothetical protein
MRRKSKRQPQHGRKLRSEEARSQDPDGHILASPGHRLHRLSRLHGAKQRLELEDILRERVRRTRIPTQGKESSLVCPWGAAKTEIDPARV